MLTDENASQQRISASRTTEPRRFVATTPRMQTWLLICTFGMLAALVAVFAVMFAVPSEVTTGWIVIALMAVGLTLFGVFGAHRWGWNRKIVICITSDGLTIDNKPGEVFSLKDAKLSLFALAITMSGTALHLQSGPHRFVLGGRDHRLGSTASLQAPPTGRLDAWLPAADFDEVLTVVARRSGLDVRRPARGEPLRCLLYPPSEPMGRFDFRVKEQPPPRRAVDLGTDDVRVIDPNTNGVAASVSRAQVTATPANYKVVNPEGSYNVAVLVVSVPSLRPLTIECRRAWRGDMLKHKTEPEFRVSAADSRALVEYFGLAASTKDRINT